jgi:hypothetical protein
MLSLGVITEAELEMVRGLAYLVWPSEQNNDGVMVQVINGRRMWNAGGKFAAVQLVGDAASFPGSYIIPLRFIRECEMLANLEAQVELFVHNGTAFAISEHARTEMELARTAPVIIEDPSDYTTKALFSSVGLQQLLEFGTLTPVEVLTEKESDSIPNVSTFVFSEGRVGVRSEYKEVGCKTAFPQWEAEISGPDGEFAVDRFMLRRLYNVVIDMKVGALPATVSVDLEDGGFIQISIENWTIQFPRVPAGAARFYSELTSRLDNLGLNVEESADGKVCVQISNCNVVMQLLDGRVPVLRSTIELISGVESTPDLLQEIQQQNEGRIFTKYFMSENSVIACADLRCSDLCHLEDHLNGLANDSDLLGTFLASLGVVGDELSLF